MRWRGLAAFVLSPSCRTPGAHLIIPRDIRTKIPLFLGVSCGREGFIAGVSIDHNHLQIQKISIRRRFCVCRNNADCSRGMRCGMWWRCNRCGVASLCLTIFGGCSILSFANSPFFLHCTPRGSGILQHFAGDQVTDSSVDASRLRTRPGGKGDLIVGRVAFLDPFGTRLG